MTESLVELRAREAEAEREWLWLVEALNTIARARAEQGEAYAFRLMQQQAMRVGHGARGGRCGPEWIISLDEQRGRHCRMRQPMCSPEV
jgi:hypothetical protein